MENGVVRVFTGVYGSFSKEESVCGKRLGQSEDFGKTRGVLGETIISPCSKEKGADKE